MLSAKSPAVIASFALNPSYPYPAVNYLLRMPELPEVETIRRDLEKTLAGATITEVWFDVPKMLQPSPEVVVQALQGYKVVKFDRIAKLLLMTLDEVTAAIHLKLSGQLILRNQKDPRSLDRFTHAVFKFNNGKELRFNEMRKFGFVKVIHTKEELDKILEGYGPEPLTESFTTQYLKNVLGKSSRAIKTVILDQTKIGGVGNIYVDEALWYTKLHPETEANKLNNKQIQELHKNINFVIKQGIDDGGTSDRDYVRIDGSEGNHSQNLKVFRQENKPCSRCGTTIKKIRVGGRGTHFCPNCQKI